MFKSALVAAALILGVQAQATTTSNNQTSNSMEVNVLVKVLVKPVNFAPVLDWTVGDNADFSLNGGFISGTMHNQVREATADGFWVQEDADLGAMGKQKIEILFDKNTGAVLQLLVNGEKQTPPSAADYDVIDSKRTTVTVPAGNFDCMYVKIHDKKQNSDEEAWANGVLVPVGGTIKSIAQSQIGPITIELTKFEKK